MFGLTQDQGYSTTTYSTSATSCVLFRLLFLFDPSFTSMSRQTLHSPSLFSLDFPSKRDNPRQNLCPYQTRSKPATAPDQHPICTSRPIDSLFPALRPLLPFTSSHFARTRSINPSLTPSSPLSPSLINTVSPRKTYTLEGNTRDDQVPLYFRVNELRRAVLPCLES